MTAISKCEQCGEDFTPKTKHKKYCSDRCKTMNFQQKRRETINKIKIDKGCELCGYNEHPAALHFDHINPDDKLFTISQDVKKKRTDIEDEIAKCRVLCANCHSIHTYNENHYRRNR